MISKLPRWILWGGALLAFSAGCVNICALMGFANLSVSHVTGNVSLFSGALADLDIKDTFYIGAVLGSFVFGSILSGFILEDEALKLGRRYGVALAIEAVMLMMAVFFFYKQLYIGEMLASMACGLQNAMIATYSGSVIRTTHLTGLTSDIGAALGNWFSGGKINKKTLLLQCVIWWMFLGGGIIGALLYKQIGFLALMLPAMIVLSAAVAYWVMLSHLPAQR